MIFDENCTDRIMLKEELTAELQEDGQSEGGDDSDDQSSVSSIVDTGAKARTRLPRSEKKRQRSQRILAEKKENRKQKKLERKERMRTEKVKEEEDEDRPSKKDQQSEIRERMRKAMLHGQRICVDLSMEVCMSTKEKSKLAAQLGRLYGANRKMECPAHIYLCGLSIDGELHEECVHKNDGFLNYMVERTEQSYTDLFHLDELVFLTPDSDHALIHIDPQKVYIIGGLVDESVTKNITKNKAHSELIQTARLPIPEYMTKVEQSSYSQVLSVNQVFEIMLTYMKTKDWSKALQCGVPKRKGYIICQSAVGPHRNTESPKKVDTDP